MLMRQHTGVVERSTYILQKVHKTLFAKLIVAVWYLPTNVKREITCDAPYYTVAHLHRFSDLLQDLDSFAWEASTAL